jgi:uncharacterized protein (DUF2147 family)
MTLRLIHFIFLFIYSFSRAQTIKPDMIIGDWTDEKKEVLIRSYKENGKYYAKILWVENLKDRGKPLPKHEQHWINMVIMKDFVFDEDEWNSGKIYVPKSNKTYTAYIKAINYNVLKITGFVWFRFLSESQIFNRVIPKK